jgi:hypothetical protein
MAFLGLASVTAIYEKYCYVSGVENPLDFQQQRFGAIAQNCYYS